MRRRLLIVGSVLAACAVGGVAYAAINNDTSPRQAFLDDVAKRLHVSPQQLRSAFQGAALDQLNAAVNAGRLTRAQANAIEQRLREGGPPPLFFRRGPSGRAPIFGVGPLAAAMQYLGVTPAQLFSELAAGKSLAQIATAHGKNVNGLENAMVAAERSRLDRARQSGVISRSQEQQLLSRLQSKTSELVNRAGFRPRFGPLGAPAPGLWFRGGPRMVPPGFMPPAAPPAP